MVAGTLYPVVTALYRRYRPETFAELIGQTQVTDPLRTALRGDRVNHAYLFSGPRGCGKTTSARILARCLNCVEGPTDTPCGVCPSCVELSRDGSGSLDVVEIDAASHGGVDDSRDLRERAIFAPARDRYKIFILDEAHMVTPQGFNALLKIVEEPPEHVKFIFATTEPDKVIGTIRSRTHHYPFRLVPPAQMLDYVDQLCRSEGVEAEAGVLSLVVRAGGGSVRDTLSLLDQLIAGSEGSTVQYERAVALLGYTHGTLLAEVVDALGARDPAAAFTAVDRVIQTGQDPRRFVEDLLEHLRDLIIVGAVSADAASAVLRGIQPDALDRMAQQAAAFGSAELSRAADVINAALTEMTGTTSPRLHLELMIARVLVPASDDSARGALVRVERLERRVGVESTVPSGPAEVTEAPASAPIPTPAAAVSPAGVPAVHVTESHPSPPAAPQFPRQESFPAPREAGAPDAESGRPPFEPVQPASVAAVHDAPAKTAKTAAPVSLNQLKDAWPEILGVVEKTKRTSWLMIYGAHVLALEGDVLYLSFPNEHDLAAFKQQHAGDGPSEHLRRAIVEVLGFRVKYVARVDAAGNAPAGDAAPATPSVAGSPQQSQDSRPQAAAQRPQSAQAPVAPPRAPAAQPQTSQPSQHIAAVTATGTVECLREHRDENVTGCLAERPDECPRDVRRPHHHVGDSRGAHLRARRRV